MGQPKYTLSDVGEASLESSSSIQRLRYLASSAPRRVVQAISLWAALLIAEKGGLKAQKGSHTRLSLYGKH
jgi:hypothetical protein